MASTYWAREALREFTADPDPERLVVALDRIVDALEELEYEKQQRPSDELW